MQTLADVAEVGGAEAVEQLQRLARQTVTRLYLRGLLRPTDLRDLLHTESLPVQKRRVALDEQDYQAGVSTTEEEWTIHGNP